MFQVTDTQKNEAYVLYLRDISVKCYGFGEAVTPFSVGHLWFYSQPPNLHGGANFWKPLGTMRTEFGAVTCADVQFRVQRQAVQLESMYITLSVSRDLKSSNGSVATRKFQSVVRTCGERVDTEWAKGSFDNGWGFRPM